MNWFLLVLNFNFKAMAAMDMLWKMAGPFTLILAIFMVILGYHRLPGCLQPRLRCCSPSQSSRCPWRRHPGHDTWWNRNRGDYQIAWHWQESPHHFHKNFHSNPFPFMSIHDHSFPFISIKKKIHSFPTLKNPQIFGVNPPIEDL